MVTEVIKHSVSVIRSVPLWDGSKAYGPEVGLFDKFSLRFASLLLEYDVITALG